MNPTIRTTLQISGKDGPIIVDNWPSTWTVRESEESLRSEHGFLYGAIKLNGLPLHLDQTFAEQMSNIDGENELIFGNGKKEFYYDFLHYFF